MIYHETKEAGGLREQKRREMGLLRPTQNCHTHDYLSYLLYSVRRSILGQRGENTVCGHIKRRSGRGREELKNSIGRRLREVARRLGDGKGRVGRVEFNTWRKKREEKQGD